VTRSLRTRWQPILLACLSIAIATFLLWPDAAKPRSITWEQLLLPLVPGSQITRGYTLSQPRRGEEHDVIFTAKRDDPSFGSPSRIEVHIVDKGQWSGIRETKSFGVAYETPRSSAATEDLEAVTETIANHLRSNDSGLPRVAKIPLADDPSPPWMTRLMDHAQGLRGLAALVFLALGLAFVSSINGRGDVAAAWLLFGIGLGLRLPNLDVPFAHDQDVQRWFTGQSSLVEILTGRGLDDRHPPLWFVVLHGAGHFGQTETIARLPAVISGACLGPAIIWATRCVRGQSGPAGALSGFVLAISPVFVMRSREVSEIPFFGLLVIIAIALSVRLSQAPSRPHWRSLVVVTTLLAWTYYLAPLVFLGIWGSLVLVRKLKRNVITALLWGILGGSPALLLGAWTIVRDHDARSVASRYPELAWGNRTVGATFAELWTQCADSVGVPIIIVATILAFISWRSRREVGTLVAMSVVVVSAVGVAIASSFARVQPYYLISVTPALALAVALGLSSQTLSAGAWTWSTQIATLLWLVHFSLPAAGLLYLADPDAFMPKFASFVLQRSEQDIMVVAHYDATLLAYYCERAAGGATVWPAMDDSGAFVLPASGRRVLPLARAHSLNEETGAKARDQLLVALTRSPALVIERDAFILPRVHEELARCETLLPASSARLLYCSARSKR